LTGQVILLSAATLLFAQYAAAAYWDIKSNAANCDSVAVRCGLAAARDAKTSAASGTRMVAVESCSSWRPAGDLYVMSDW
jgi:hypothetical protein